MDKINKMQMTNEQMTTLKTHLYNKHTLAVKIKDISYDIDDAIMVKELIRVIHSRVGCAIKSLDNFIGDKIKPSYDVDELNSSLHNSIDITAALVTKSTMEYINLTAALDDLRAESNTIDKHIEEITMLTRDINSSDKKCAELNARFHARFGVTYTEAAEASAANTRAKIVANTKVVDFEN